MVIKRRTKKRISGSDCSSVKNGLGPNSVALAYRRRKKKRKTRQLVKFTTKTTFIQLC